MKYFPAYLLVLLLVASCGTDNVTPVDIGLDYFPLRTGVYQVYRVNQVVYSEVKAPETSSYLLKIEMADSFPGTDGVYTYAMRRMRRANDTESWSVVDTWSVRGNDRELVVNEGNIPFVKLTFPVRNGAEWNANKLNNRDEDYYEVTSVDERIDIGGMIFDKTLRILQEDNDDVIVFQDRREEIYARGVGLVFKEVVQLRYCTDPGCIGQQQIESGIEYKQEIIEYGAQ